MEKIEIVFDFMRHIAAGLLIEGLVVIVLGILILFYPYLLALLVSVGLVIVGAMSVGLAIKLFRFSKLQIKL